MEGNKDNSYKVYMHTNKINGKKYIGITKTSVDRRWQNGHGYKGCTLFNRAIEKYGWNNFEHDILYDGLSKEEAEQKEIELISKYQSNNKDFGYNLESGGNCAGMHSAETIEKISKALRGRKQPKEVIEKRTKSLKGKKKMTADDIKKLNEAKHRPVIQYSVSGDFIAEYKSIKDAAILNGFKSPNNINRCCLGYNNFSYGYIWRYKEDKLDIDNLPHVKEKPVVQLTKDFKFIKRYESATKAAKENGWIKNPISICCNHKGKTAYGYVWMFEKEYLDDDKQHNI